MARRLRRQVYIVGWVRVRRLMARMGLAPIYQKPRTTIPHPRSIGPTNARCAASLKLC